MRITTWARYDRKFRLLAESTRLYVGPIALAKGASGAENQLQQQQSDFYKTLTSNYQTQFANQSAIFNSIQSVFNPILQAGPNQYGFSNQEDAALRTQATEGTAASFANARSATAQALASSGGGNDFLPSGANANIQTNLEGQAAATQSNQQLGITEAGYQQGYNQFTQASNALGSVAAGLNPLGYAGAATPAGNSAFGSASTIQQQNNAASPWGTIGGILGGAASQFLGDGLSNLTNGLSFLGNAGSSNVISGFGSGPSVIPGSTPDVSPHVPGVF